MQLSRKTSDTKRIIHGDQIRSGLEIQREGGRPMVVREEEENFITLHKAFVESHDAHDLWTRLRRARSEDREQAMKSLAWHVQDHLRILKMNARRLGYERDPLKLYHIPKEADRPRTHRDKRWFHIAESVIEGDARVRESDIPPVREITGEDIQKALDHALQAQTAYISARSWHLDTKIELRKVREIFDRRVQKIRTMITCELQEQQARREKIRNILRAFGYEYKQSDGDPSPEQGKATTKQPVAAQGKAEKSQGKNNDAVSETKVLHQPEDQADTSPETQKKEDQPLPKQEPETAKRELENKQPPSNKKKKKPYDRSKKKVRGKRNKKKAQEHALVWEYDDEHGQLASLEPIPPGQRGNQDGAVWTDEEIDFEDDL